YGEVKIWDLATGQELRTLRGHAGGIFSVAYSPDGQRLATSSEDKTIKIWDRSGKELLTLQGHTQSVWTVAFSPDSQKIASGGFDRTVRLWDARTGHALHMQ